MSGVRCTCNSPDMAGNPLLAHPACYTITRSGMYFSPIHVSIAGRERCFCDLPAHGDHSFAVNTPKVNVSYAFQLMWCSIAVEDVRLND